MSSPEGEPSPKRQRRSYSPASPPVGSDTKPAAVQQPQTPPPSVHMSPSWQSQPLPGLQYTGQGNGGSGSGSVSGGSVTFPTPPSTAGLQSQTMARGASSEGDSAAQTPAYSKGEGAGDGDAEMQDAKEESQGADVVMTADDMDADAEHRRSDHERNEANDVVPPLPAVHALYKLPTQSTHPSQPHPSQNLIQLYSLQRIQASVARRDPVTGEKAVKLRKSYEGKVKDLGIEGRNKATKSEDILGGLVHPDWSVMLPEGKTLWQNSDLCNPPLEENSLAVDEHGLESAVLSSRLPDLLSQALDMRPGHLPAREHREWKSLLGLDEPLNNTTAAAGGAVRGAATTAPTPNGPASTTAAKVNGPLSSTSRLTTQPGSVVRNSAPASPHSVPRPDRAGKKRRYDESSYAGYAEGYEDDGYSTGGGLDERRGSGGRRGSSSAGNKRQKRKESSFSGTTPTSASSTAPTSATSTSPPFSATATAPTTTPGGGNSMVGVKSS